MLCGSKGNALSLCTERREIRRRPCNPEHGTNQEVVDPVSAGQVVVEQAGEEGDSEEVEASGAGMVVSKI
jgi:hypothetical protein